MSRVTWNTAAEPLLQDHILKRERDREILHYFSCSADWSGAGGLSAVNAIGTQLRPALYHNGHLSLTLTQQCLILATDTTMPYSASHLKADYRCDTWQAVLVQVASLFYRPVVFR